MIKSFNPIIDHQSKVLILGTMPSVQSLDKGQYYANPRNHFWPIIYEIFQEQPETDYQRKIELLKRNKIALWDVLDCCTREGSLDTDIKNEKPNDIIGLLEKYLNIRYIILNGTKAHSLFKKHIGFSLSDEIKFKQLPSTSPTPGKNVKTYSEKLEEWAIVKEYKDN
jgi:hypoxanthine-DNA glycosylase